MANIKKFRAHESLNIESAGDWQVQSAVTVDSDGVAVDCTAYHQVHILTDKDIYFMKEILLWGLSSYKKLTKKRTLEGLEFKDSIGSYLKNLNS